MEAYLDHEIKALKTEMDSLTRKKAIADHVDAAETVQVANSVPGRPPEDDAVERLNQQLARLEQIRTWLAQDRNLRNRGLPMIGTESWNKNLAQTGYSACLELDEVLRCAATR